jgi:hypothetical protein
MKDMIHGLAEGGKFKQIVSNQEVYERVIIRIRDDSERMTKLN